MTRVCRERFVCGPGCGMRSFDAARSCPIRGRRLSAGTSSPRRFRERREHSLGGIRLAVADGPIDQLTDLALVPHLLAAHPVDVAVEIDEEPLLLLVGGRLELGALHLVDLD